MRVRLGQLRSLIREQLTINSLRGYVALLAEGFQQDKGYLISKYPEFGDELRALEPKEVAWLTARFGPKPKAKETNDFGKVLATLQEYTKIAKGLGDSYSKNPTFKELVDAAYAPGSKERKWSQPADFMTMSSDAMRKIMGLSSRSFSKIQIDHDETGYDMPMSDFIGQVGDWKIWRPSSTENSCKIAGYDPVTLKPETEWCTARTKSDNLFRQYVEVQGYTLFYLTNESLTGPESKLSLGFNKRGEFVPSRDAYGASVDGKNVGIDYARLVKILGKDYPIISLALENVVAKAPSSYVQKILRIGNMSEDELVDLIYNDPKMVYAASQGLGVDLKSIESRYLNSVANSDDEQAFKLGYVMLVLGNEDDHLPESARNFMIQNSQKLADISADPTKPKYFLPIYDILSERVRDDELWMSMFNATVNSSNPKDMVSRLLTYIGGAGSAPSEKLNKFFVDIPENWKFVKEWIVNIPLPDYEDDLYAAKDMIRSSSNPRARLEDILEGIRGSYGVNNLSYSAWNDMYSELSK